MSAKTLLVNEGYLVELEKCIKEIREKGGEMVRAMGGRETSFANGVEMVLAYSGAVVLLQEIGQRLFAAMDIVDPEDNEMLTREHEDDESEEEEGEESEGEPS